MRLRSVILSLLVLLFCSSFSIWGFVGHRLITSMAIHTLPTQMISFYKKNADIIIEHSIIPDQRRYVVPEEGPRHYIDMDDYGHRDSIPKFWNQAIEKYGEEYLIAHGLGPWNAYFTYLRLVNAFEEKDRAKIIRLSSDLAHYLADANVPLHTTSNYNGQQTDQHGIHGFWETRLPQLFSDNYDFLVGQAKYLPNPQLTVWEGVYRANDLVDSVFIVEKLATSVIGEDQKYGFEDNGKSLQKVYSRRYSIEYHRIMPRVEQQMQYSIKMIGDFWFTAWIEAGQPDLSPLDNKIVEKETTEFKRQITPKRLHEHEF